jgi:hypothetical protein
MQASTFRLTVRSNMHMWSFLPALTGNSIHDYDGERSAGTAFEAALYELCALSAHGFLQRPNAHTCVTMTCRNCRRWIANARDSFAVYRHLDDLLFFNVAKAR